MWGVQGLQYFILIFLIIFCSCLVNAYFHLSVSIPHHIILARSSKYWREISVRKLLLLIWSLRTFLFFVLIYIYSLVWLMYLYDWKNFRKLNLILENSPGKFVDFKIQKFYEFPKSIIFSLLSKGPTIFLFFFFCLRFYTVDCIHNLTSFLLFLYYN